MWLPSSSHWVALSSLVEVGGESINLMEERGQCWADFWRVVKGGQMTERWRKSHGGCRSWVGIGCSPHSAMIFSGKAQAFNTGRGEGTLQMWMGILKADASCENVWEFTALVGAVGWLRPLPGWLKGSISLHISSFKNDVYIPRCFPFLLQSLSVLGLLCFADFQFSCVQLQHPRRPCPSPTPGVYPNICSLSRWYHSTISASVIPFSFCPQSSLASGSFQMSQFFASGGLSIGVSAPASVLPMNTQDWSPLGWTGWISLQSKGLKSLADFKH